MRESALALNVLIVSGFFEELKRRKVYRVAVGYVVRAGGLIQLASLRKNPRFQQMVTKRGSAANK